MDAWIQKGLDVLQVLACPWETFIAGKTFKRRKWGVSDNQGLERDFCAWLILYISINKRVHSHRNQPSRTTQST